MLTMKQRSTLGNEALILRSHEVAEGYRWFLGPLAADGVLSLNQMAKTLNSYRIATPTGVGTWQKETVRRTLQRLGLYGRAAA